MLKKSFSGRSHFSSIRLAGMPYVQALHDLNISADVLAETSDYEKKLESVVSKHSAILGMLKEGNFFSRMDRKLKSGENLSFEEAFCSTAFVCAYLNKPLGSALCRAGSVFPDPQTHMLQATALLSNLSVKESLVGLTSDEIAGLVASVIDLDTIVRLPSSGGSVLCFGGMGGDKGYDFLGNSKLFSLSTLAAFGAALSGLTHKHHSYPNTSKVAGQTTLEAFGARSDFTSCDEMRDIFNRASLIMTSCHNTRSIHALSHILRGETINHLIGPIAYTIDKETKVQPFIGVNEKVHPQTLIEAILKLEDRGIQEYDCGVVFCGLSVPIEKLSKEQKEKLARPEIYYSDTEARSLIRLDEIAPPPYGTLASFFINKSFVGNYLLSAEDFYSPEELAEIKLEELLIPNTYDSIMEANYIALKGGDVSKTHYLAMTIGLANFLRFSLLEEDSLNRDNMSVNRGMLRMHTKEALRNLKDGLAFNKMLEYCQRTQGITNSLAYVAE